MLDIDVSLLRIENSFSLFSGPDGKANCDEIETTKKSVYSIAHLDNEGFLKRIGFDMFLRINLIVRYAEYAYHLGKCGQEALDLIWDAAHSFGWDERNLVEAVTRAHGVQIYRTLRVRSQFDDWWENWLDFRTDEYEYAFGQTEPVFANRKMAEFHRDLKLLRTSLIVMGEAKDRTFLDLVQRNLQWLVECASKEFDRVSESLPKKADHFSDIFFSSDFTAMTEILLKEDVGTIIPQLPSVITDEMVRKASRLVR